MTSFQSPVGSGASYTNPGCVARHKDPQCRNRRLKTLLTHMRMAKMSSATMNIGQAFSRIRRCPESLSPKLPGAGRLSTQDCPGSRENHGELRSVFLALGSCRHGDWKCRHILAVLESLTTCSMCPDAEGTPDRCLWGLLCSESASCRHGPRWSV